MSTVTIRGRCSGILIAADSFAPETESHSDLAETVSLSRVRVPNYSDEFGLIEGASLLRGTVVAEKLTANAKDFITDIVFSATDYRTVTWTSGTLKFADGKTFSIVAGSTGVMAGGTYIYFDESVSATVLGTTTDVANSVGEHIVTLCVAVPTAATDQHAVCIPAVGVFGINETVIGPYSISTGKLQALAVTTDCLAANAVSSAKIDTAVLNAIYSSLGDATAGSICIGSTNKIWLNDASDGCLAIGGSVKANAPFRVTQAGDLTANNATITASTLTTAASGSRVAVGTTDLAYVTWYSGATTSGNIYGSGQNLYVSANSDLHLEAASNIILSASIANITLLGNGLTYNSNTIWHAGNDGSSSGLDADLWDGKHMPANAVGNLHNDGNGNLSWV